MPFSQDKPILKKDPTDTEFTDGKAIFITVMSIMNVFMFFGNILSIITITTNKRLRNQVSYWFVLNLAVIDFIIAVTVVPLNIVWEYYGSWPLNKASCEVFTFADISFSTISAYSIVLVSIDKYVYITYPMKYFDKMTKKVALFLIIAVWIMVLTFTSISVTTEVGTSEEFRDHFYAVTNSTQTCLFVMTDTYVIPSALICFFIPLTILCFTSSKIICIASNHIRKIHEVSHSQSVCMPSDTNSDTRRTLSNKYQPPRQTDIISRTTKQSTHHSLPVTVLKSGNNETCKNSSILNCVQDRTNCVTSQNKPYNNKCSTSERECNQTLEFENALECNNVSLCLQRETTASEKEDMCEKNSRNINKFDHESHNREMCDSNNYRNINPNQAELNQAQAGSKGTRSDCTYVQADLVPYCLQKQPENSAKSGISLTRISKLDNTSDIMRTNTEHSVKKNSLKKMDSNRNILQRKYPYCKLFGTVTIVILCFVVMFSPYYVATMVDVACHCIDPWIYEDILSVLYYMHSLVNPYIYMSTDRKYKAALRSLCRRIFKQ